MLLSSLRSAALCALLSLVAPSRAATRTYDFTVEWVTANPDGQMERPVMGINGQWPIPYITADVGDRVIVNVVNNLGNQTTGLHFHGLYQNGTANMDGPVRVTQCPIPPGGKFTYDFEIKQPGTYWYHAHDAGQYPDGLRGPLIIHDPDSPYKDDYDEERVLTLSDWYHDQMPGLIKNFIRFSNPTGAEPVPQSALMNDTQNLEVSVEPGKTYLFRIINMAAFAAQHVWFEGHTMRIVEVDGIYTDPAEADMIYLTAAQRYSVLITMKDDASANYAFVGSMDEDLFDAVPDGLNPNVTGWLVYDKSKDLPKPTLLEEFDDFDDYTLVPQDKQKLYDQVDHSITLDMKMDNLGDGANYAFFNDQTYVRPVIPSLYTALTTGDAANDPRVYGANANAYILKKDEVVEIILNSLDPGKHPFHLHGHYFQAVVRGEEEAGLYMGNDTLPEYPMKRDTFMVRPNSYIVLRFRADNPDKLTWFLRVWLFHCHIEWHVASGLVATLVEAPTELQQTLTIQEGHLDTCKAQGIAVAGNAAGNTMDLFDLKGENLSPAPLPAGFTARGIVALVFSVISAFLGLAAITWYGLSDIGREPSRGVLQMVSEK